MGAMGRNRRSRALRQNLTDAERLLWALLRGQRFGGFKFRRQHPLGRFFVDFVCLEQSLVVEVDGNHHAEQSEYDEARELWLEAEGFRTIRFSNREVLTDVENVKRAMWQALTTPTPTLPPEGGGSQKA